MPLNNHQCKRRFLLSTQTVPPNKVMWTKRGECVPANGDLWRLPRPSIGLAETSKSGSISNKVDHPPAGGEAVSVWKVGDCMGMMLLHPCRKLVVSLNVVEWHRRLCVHFGLSRLCCISGIVCGIPMGFWWTVKILLRIDIPEEVDGTVVDVSWPLSSSLASSPCTLPALAGTSLQQTWFNKCALLDILYLMDVLHVVYMVICAPPPSSLG